MTDRLPIFFLLLLSIFSVNCSVRGVYIDTAYRQTIPVVPADSIVHSVFLIGDAGEPSAEQKEETFLALTRMASVRSEQNTIVFLGDNLYPRGLPPEDDPQRREMERRLDEQIAIGTGSGALTVFVPGNHDWAYQGAAGSETLRREEMYIRSKGRGTVRLLPENGLPGPHTVDIGTELRLVAIDTQWWLHAFDKPLFPGDTSETQSRRRWLDSLTTVLADTGGRTVIVAAHHPIVTHGEHGGFFGWEDHLFPLRKIQPWLWIPLPGIGSLYPLSRIWGISDQDLSGAGNAAMIRGLDSVLSIHSPVAYAAGHEHVLQVLQKRAEHYYLVSGNGIAKHKEALTVGDDTILATREKGFMRVDLLRNNRVLLSVYGIEQGEPVRIYSMMLR